MNTVNWRPISDPPTKSGYVLLAVTHHQVPMVLMGHCKIRKNDYPYFSEDVYRGNGVAITHWAEVPKHPLEEMALAAQDNHDENGSTRPEVERFCVVFRDKRLMVHRNGEPYSIYPPLSKHRVELLESIADWQKRGADVQLYHNPPPQNTDVCDLPDADVISITAETVGPYRCKHDGPGTGCSDSEDGSCSACPHGVDMSKEKESEVMPE